MNAIDYLNTIAILSDGDDDDIIGWCDPDEFNGVNDELDKYFQGLEG